MLHELDGDLISRICMLVELPVMYDAERDHMLTLGVLGQVCSDLYLVYKQRTNAQNLLVLAAAMDASKQNRRLRLNSYFKTMRLRCALSGLWNGIHPHEMVVCVAECPNAARKGLKANINAYVAKREYELLGRYINACTGLVVTGLMFAFSNTGHNRGAQLDLLGWFERWLGSTERCALLNAVSDHEVLLERVAQELRVKHTGVSPFKRKLPISFSSPNARVEYAKRIQRT